MPKYTNTTSYTEFKVLLETNPIIETDDWEADTYQFKLVNDKIQFRRKRGLARWSKCTTSTLAIQFGIGRGRVGTARVG